MTSTAEMVVPAHAHWDEFADCRDTDPAMWDVELQQEEDRQIAAAMCLTCPVFEQCLAAAIKQPPYRMMQAGLVWIGGEGRNPFEVRYQRKRRAAKVIVVPVR